MANLYDALHYLNNVGTTLLKQHRYNESVETFADAFYIHQQFLTKNNVHDTATTTFDKYNNNNTIIDLIQVSLQRASKRLAQASAQQQKQQTCIDSRHLILDHFVVLDIRNIDCARTILQFGSAIDQVDFVIRMNQQEEAEDFDSDDHKTYTNIRRKLDSAILFLNYGVACKRASQYLMDDFDDNTEEIRNKLHCQSVKLFDLSNQIANNVIACLNYIVKQQRVVIHVVDVKHQLEIKALMVSMFTSAHISDYTYWQRSSSDNDDSIDSIEPYSDFQTTLQSFRILNAKLYPLLMQHAASA